jgi:hypothetical protein
LASTVKASDEACHVQYGVDDNFGCTDSADMCVMSGSDGFTGVCTLRACPSATYTVVVSGLPLWNASPAQQCDYDMNACTQKSRKETVRRQTGGRGLYYAMTRETAWDTEHRIHSC